MLAFLFVITGKASDWQRKHKERSVRHETVKVFIVGWAEERSPTILVL
ncbi:MAG: hypothetical protein BMS9Abin33_0397 [Gammaproteobacteria bacterium]|nr:MAG: hypothetical protein BMS9Abin33_0397 [Gammaproteobacteria bacterium]